jgi:heme/copper-type cytochrome/quinol oxidase subunit 4
MRLRGYEYLAVVLSCVATGLWLPGQSLPRSITPFLPDFFYIVFMALSVLCLWSSVKFLLLNRRRKDAVYLLIVLMPIIVIALYVVGSYVIYLAETYHTIYRFNAHYLPK